MMYTKIWDVLIATILLQFADTNTIPDFQVVSRSEWGARPSVKEETMKSPAPFVVIHHSFLPPACYTSEDCLAAMKWMQDLHQINNSWNDIGYSFAIGGDGLIYQGRGWSNVGAHAPKFNDKSIGICLIGDWRVELPPQNMLNAAHRLIEKGVNEGYIAKNYRLVGHKTVRNGTDCPGERLMDEIKTWPGYTDDPNKDGSTTNQIEEDLINTNKLRKRTTDWNNFSLNVV